MSRLKNSDPQDFNASYHYISHKPSRPGLQTQSYCFATVMSPGEITSRRRAINIDLFALFHLFYVYVFGNMPSKFSLGTQAYFSS